MERQTTLSKFLILHLSQGKAESDLAALLIDVAAAIKKISAITSKGSLSGYLTELPAKNLHGETQKKLDELSNQAMIEACESGGQIAGIISDGVESPYEIPDSFLRGQYLLAFNPIDGSSNTDMNVSVGTIFSVLKFTGKNKPEIQDFLQASQLQIAAGYAVYGPATMLVITVGCGTHGFTLDKEVGNFVLTHPDIHIPRETNEIAINSSHELFWEPPVQRYINECKSGLSGNRKKEFNMRWGASNVTDVHRVLMRGGVFMYPKDSKEPLKPGHLRLLSEAQPLSMVVTQAGGLASTGRQRISAIKATTLHQRVSVILGSTEEVDRIERFHQEYDQGTDTEFASPLFMERSLFRD